MMIVLVGASASQCCNLGCCHFVRLPHNNAQAMHKECDSSAADVSISHCEGTDEFRSRLLMCSLHLFIRPHNGLVAIRFRFCAKLSLFFLDDRSPEAQDCKTILGRSVP